MRKKNFGKFFGKSDPKNLDFYHFSTIFRKTGIFPENPAVSVSSPYWCLTSCKVSEKSFEPFTRNVRFPFHPHHPRTAMIAIPLRAISGRGVKKGNRNLSYISYHIKLQMRFLATIWIRKCISSIFISPIDRMKSVTPHSKRNGRLSIHNFNI